MLALAETMLKEQAERARKSDLTKRLIYKKDGKVKSMITILKELQRGQKNMGNNGK